MSKRNEWKLRFHNIKKVEEEPEGDADFIQKREEMIAQMEALKAEIEQEPIEEKVKQPKANAKPLLKAYNEIMNKIKPIN